MKTETASFLKSAVLRNALSLVAGAVCLLAVGCKSKGSSADAGPTMVLDNCSSNVTSSAATATALTSGQSYQSKICYEGTSNWYLVTVPMGSTLLDVAAGYGSGANTAVDLDFKLFYKTNATTLTQVQEIVAPAQSDAGVDTIQTTLHVLQPGDYYIQISDAHNMAFDATNAYTLTVAYAVDPDSHEPNDTPCVASQPDSKPGYLAYLGDLDVFKTSAASASDILTLSINNKSSGAINYQITSPADAGCDAMGSTLAEGTAPPSSSFNTAVAVMGAGEYFVTLSYPSTTVPDRTSGYVTTFGTVPNPDTVNNHTVATATCPGGGTGPCSMAFSGQPVTLPPVMGFLSVPGQADFYRVDVTSGAALVLQMNLTSSASTTVKYAVDVLTPADGRSAQAPTSPCMVDTDCAAIKLPCTADTTCELSHACDSDAGECEGAGVCIPSSGGSGPGVCAIAQYLSSYTGPMGSGMAMGASTVSTAQPLFSNGSYYIRVHDATYTNFDLTNPYTLSLAMAPEPDVNDQSPDGTKRNNFYNPYPTAASNLSPNAVLAIDITPPDAGPVIGDASTPSSWKATGGGNISYQTDEDWFKFEHPCPGQNCGLTFTWSQPGPSPVQVAFFMLNGDLSPHESFTYTGSTPTTSLTGAATSTFGGGGPNGGPAEGPDADCAQCSFAGSTVSNSSGPYYYFLRIADLKEKAWDYTQGHSYNFTITATPGCPAACDKDTAQVCVCFCPSGAGGGSCPGPML